MPAPPTDFDRWVFRPCPRPAAALRLLCLPYAGGSVVAYHGWAELLPAAVEVWALRLPGREARVREPLRTDLAGLVRDAAGPLAERLDSPYALFGHSLGALVAFELARELRRRGRPAAQLAVSGRPAPQRPQRYPPIHRLPDAEFLAALDQRFQAIPPLLREDRAVRELYLPILRADTTMLETYAYRPEPPLGCPLAIYGGRADPEVSPADLAEWQVQTQAGSAVATFPGGHFYLQEQRAELLADLGGRLAGALVP